MQFIINSNKTIWSTSKYYQYKKKISIWYGISKKPRSTEVENVMNKLSIVKAFQKDDIPTKNY